MLLLSLIVGCLIGGVAGYLGTLMLSRRMALVAGPLGHLALPGIALALIYNFDVSLGAFPFIILGIFLIWVFETRTKLPIESLTAIIFAFGMSIAFLFLPIEQAKTALIGDVFRIGIPDAILSIFLSIFVFALTKSIYQKVVLVSISEDLAKCEKIDPKKYNLIYLLGIAIMVALGVKIVGGLLTAALVAIPAATSRRLSKNLVEYSILGLIFGSISPFFGILFSTFTSLPAGPLTIIIATSFFVISAIFKR